MRELSLFPVLCGSAVSTMGSLMLMDNIVELLPNPVEGNMRKGMLPSGDKEEYAVSPGGVPSAFVFKTVSDQYGKYSFIKVISGTITSDLALVNARTGSPEKLGRLYTMRARRPWRSRSSPAATSAHRQDGEGQDRRYPVRRPEGRRPEGTALRRACYSVAIVPKTRGQEDKIAQGLARMNEEDPTFSVTNNAETHQMVLNGSGDMQVDVLVSKLKSRFNVEAELKAPGWPIVRRSARQSPNRAATKADRRCRPVRRCLGPL